MLTALDCHNANELIKLFKIVESYDEPTEDRGGSLDLTVSQQTANEQEAYKQTEQPETAEGAGAPHSICRV